MLKDKFRYFNSHAQRITDLSWNVHTVGVLASSSFDGTVQVGRELCCCFDSFQTTSDRKYFFLTMLGAMSPPSHSTSIKLSLSYIDAILPQHCTASSLLMLPHNHDVISSAVLMVSLHSTEQPPQN